MGASKIKSDEVHFPENLLKEKDKSLSLISNGEFCWRVRVIYIYNNNNNNQEDEEESEISCLMLAHRVGKEI